jgi:hypothetical protein
MTIIKAIELLIALTRLFDLVIDEMAKRADAKDLEKLRLAIETAKMARSPEDKQRAAKEIRDAF